ncbi:MAG TPA: SUMF1/EgtB/PvdO family nonheme iron enzyme [Polyangiaceae bacterium]
MIDPIRTLASALAFVATIAAASALLTSAPKTARAQAPTCPSSMVRVQNFCIDRWEIMTVDHRTGQPLSPYYPPHAGRLQQALRIWQIERLVVGDPAARALPLPPIPEVQRGRFEPRAVSLPGVVPQGYLSHALAARACANAGKRLCTEAEWVTACQAAPKRKYPYGDQFEWGACNVYRFSHPAFVLHGVSFVGHTDPRLNLVSERGEDPLLRLTGGTERCRSQWPEGSIHDMVGNLDEWIDDPNGTFVGGFYARSTREGCAAKIESHSAEYYDYSLGTRCCTAAK